MIKLRNRQEILSLNPTFASFVSNIQDAKYNPVLEHNKLEPGEMYIDESDKTRYLSQAECDILNTEAFESYKANKDHIESSSIQEKYWGEAVYTLVSDDINIYIEKLSDNILLLSEKLHCKSLIFLLEYATPWLSQNNDFPLAKNSVDYLKRIGVDPKFMGGFQSSGQDIKEFTQHLFWFIRSHAALPDCYFSAGDSDFVANICQYGNIHFYFYSEKDALQVDDTAQEIGFISVENGQCHDHFTDNQHIDGRQIIM